MVVSKPITWILLEGQPNLPEEFYTLDLTVYRLISRRTFNLSILSVVTEWDWRRADRSPSKCIRDHAISSIHDLSRNVTWNSLLVVSGPRTLVEQLGRVLQRTVHWLSIGGLGATERQAVWPLWLAGAQSISIDLDSYRDGKRWERYGVRELRVNRSSPAVTQLGLLRASVALVERLASGADPEPRFDEPPVTQAGPAVNSPLIPSLLHLLHVTSRIVYRTLWNRISRSNRLNDQWVIGIGSAPEPGSGDGLPALPRIGDIRWIQPSPHRFIADPFLLRLGANVILFFEELCYSDSKGRLKALPLDPYGRPAGSETTVLERPYHLSFPFVFEHPAEPGSLFLLPEQAESGETVLYRSVKAADIAALRFHEDAKLLPGFPGIDPVIHEWQGQHYLFVSDGAHGNYDNNLQLFVSAELRGPYHPHPRTPIRLGLRGSRMAGPLFRQANFLFRPAQDCQSRYGARIIIYRVDLLTPSEYRETEVAVFSLDRDCPYGCGCHTIVWHEGLVAIDGVRRIANWVNRSAYTVTPK